MNYEEMSDDEVAVRVLRVFGYKSIDYGDGYEILLSKERRKDVGRKASAKFKFDPCNNPSDAWPIILVNRINVYASEGPDFMPWMAGCDGLMVSHKNPLRAAMIVFLMMQEKAK